MTQNEFLQILIIYFSKFSSASLPACLMHSVKCSGKLPTATALLLWQKCLEFREKHLTILNACVHALFYYSFSFGPSLWVAIAP